MFGIVVPRVKFRFDAFGRPPPLGNTVRNDDAVGSTAVTFNTTAATPDDGTPPRPSTGRSNVAPAPSDPPPARDPSTVENPGRVSNKRAGSNDSRPPIPNETEAAPDVPAARVAAVC